ncbi:helix-turn-helix domain-containing protein [Microvirga brassicacearum]|uniref:Cyclic nucleotide-binding domain-containing protein n=1 Tax=Microvirga brassicacearum TaxID=2580413 RepID=A0A5N3PAS8_9HYPH|nr:helix-turn-helix domain-containing protein [Microvirga brassicacearum]KAB0266852.1 cyclic nucleotide-binding domain-containing protein [Microvirga brassicacearum]
MHTALSTDHFSPSGVIVAPGLQSLRIVDEPWGLTQGRTRSHASDEEIFSEGSRAAFFYKVVSGAVRTFKHLSDGRRQIDAFHLPGDLFGIESGDEHRFSAEAVGAATLVSYRRCSFEIQASARGQLGPEIIAAVMRSLERAQSHMMLLGRKSALEKIATFLLDMAKRMAKDDEFDLPMPRIDIADHLGLTIETVSRCLTQLEREGVIRLPASRHVVLRNKAILRRLRA